MKNFADQLIETIRLMKNPTVMGLDPLLDYVPEHIVKESAARYKDPAHASAQAILEFNKALIDATSDIIPAIKPQFAYYEMYGVHGIKTLVETIEYARSKGMLVIADAKRNDIGSTAQAYATSILGKTTLSDGQQKEMFGADAVTLNGYLGIDGIKPFISIAKSFGKGMFILVHTSNPSSVEIQELELKDGRLLYEAVAEKVASWGEELVGNHGYSSVGAVVGATWPEQAKKLRQLMPQTFFLVPGYGAQGGDAQTVKSCFDKNGDGAIVNASRSLMCAYKKNSAYDTKDFMLATREEAIRMREDLNKAIY
ncbi:MAG TPA: orotidine-5'-phosphate decarboxylase [Clostridiaceae bacterium]|nr:orotidine-5'-phosphate decarboxylase [Clostridiaceae bacterium]